MSFSIRNYRDDDLEAIAGLKTAAAAADQLHEGVRVGVPADYLAPADPNPRHNAFVAEDDGGCVIGWARLYLETGPEQSFFLTFPLKLPAWRGKGIERLLLERLWKRAEERRG